MDPTHHDRPGPPLVDITTTIGSGMYPYPGPQHRLVQERPHLQTAVETEISEGPTSAEEDHFITPGTTGSARPIAAAAEETTARASPLRSHRLSHPNRRKITKTKSNFSSLDHLDPSQPPPFDPEIATQNWQIYRDPSPSSCSQEPTEDSNPVPAHILKPASLPASDPLIDNHIDDGGANGDDDDKSATSAYTSPSIIASSPEADPAVKRMVQRMARTLNEVFAEQRQGSMPGQGLSGSAPLPIADAGADIGAGPENDRYDSNGTRATQAMIVEKLQRRYAELSVVEEGVGRVMATTTTCYQGHNVQLGHCVDDDDVDDDQLEYNYDLPFTIDQVDTKAATGPSTSDTTKQTAVHASPSPPPSPPRFPIQPPPVSSSDKTPRARLQHSPHTKPLEPSARTLFEPTSFAARMKRLLGRGRAVRSRMRLGRQQQRQQRQQRQQQRQHVHDRAAWCIHHKGPYAVDRVSEGKCEDDNNNGNNDDNNDNNNNNSNNDDNYDSDSGAGTGPGSGSTNEPAQQSTNETSAESHVKTIIRSEIEGEVEVEMNPTSALYTPSLPPPLPPSPLLLHPPLPSSSSSSSSSSSPHEYPHQYAHQHVHQAPAPSSPRPNKRVRF